MIAKKPQTRDLWLDAVRAFAIVWVFINHVAEKLFGTGSFFANPRENWPDLDDRLSQIEPLSGSGIWDVLWNPLRYTGWLGDTGVQLFLIGTGFVLTRSLIRKRQNVDPEGDAELEGFRPKRFARLFPTFWVIVAAILVLSIGAYVAGFGPDRYMVLPWTREFWLSLVGIRVDSDTLYWGSPSWWYIGLLVQLYLIFPLLWKGLKSLGAGVFLWMVGGAMVAIRLAGLIVFNEFWPSYLDAWSRGAIVLTRLPEVIFGMSLAWWAQYRPQAADLIFRTPAAYFGLLLLVDGFVASFYLVGNAISPALLGIGSFLILTRVFRNFNAESRAGQAWQWLGEHSLVIFLINQHLIRLLVPTGLDSPIRAIGGIVVAAVMCIVLTFIVERVVEVLTDLYDLWKTHDVASRNLAGLATIAVVLFGAVVGLSALASSGERYEIAGWGARPALTADADVGWHLKPGINKNVSYVGNSYTVTSNSLGFAGPEVELAPATDDTLRILVTGDGFSSAEGVNTDQAWPRLLENILVDATTDDVDVVNMAITGWGPNQQRAALEMYANDLAPDVILVQVSLDDFADVLLTNEDFYDQIGFGSRGPNHPLRFVELQDLRAAVKNGFTDDIRERFTDTPNPLGYQYGQFAQLEDGVLEAGDTAEVAMRDAYKAMVAIAEDAGAELMFVMVPSPVQVCNRAALDYFPEPFDLTSERWDVDAPQRLVADIASDLDVPFHDLSDALSEGLCTYQTDNRYLISRGHELAAADIGQWIADTAPIDAELDFTE